MKNALYGFIGWLLKRIMKKPEILGTEHIEKNSPSIFVSNHLGYYAPLKLMVFADINFIPWVIHDVTEKKLCGEYLRIHFLEPTLGLKSPASRLIASILSPICVGLMHYKKAIPVYRSSKRIFETLELSISHLEKNSSLLIFPEIEDENEGLGKFNTGFVNVARFFFKRHNETVNFYPVCVNKDINRVTVGAKISFNPEKSFYLEKIRIVGELENHIRGMLCGGDDFDC